MRARVHKQGQKLKQATTCERYLLHDAPERVQNCRLWSPPSDRGVSLFFTRRQAVESETKVVKSNPAHPAVASHTAAQPSLVLAGLLFI